MESITLEGVRRLMNGVIGDKEIQRRSYWAREFNAAEKRRMDIERNVFIIGFGFVMGYFGYDLIDYIRAFF